MHLRLEYIDASRSCFYACYTYLRGTTRQRPPLDLIQNPRSTSYTVPSRDDGPSIRITSSLLWLMLLAEFLPTLWPEAGVVRAPGCLALWRTRGAGGVPLVSHLMLSHKHCHSIIGGHVLSVALSGSDPQEFCLKRFRTFASDQIFRIDTYTLPHPFRVFSPACDPT